MKITEIAIKKSVGTALVTITIVLLGVFSIPRIPVSFWPEFIAPSLVIITPYPGVGPEEIEEQIAKPLEEELSTIDGVEEIETSCMDGICRVIVRFDWGMDFEETKINVQEKTNKARARFPREALEPQVLQVQDFIPPGIELGFYSEKRDLNEVRNFVDTKLKNRFLRLENVATAQLFGGFESHIAIKVQADKLIAQGISFPQIAAVVAAENRDVSVGKMESEYNENIIRTAGKFSEVESVGNTIITYRNGLPVYLRDVATISFENKEQRSRSRLNGKEIVGLSIREKSGGNTVAMVDEVKELLSDLRAIIPDDIQVEIIRDQSLFIKKSIRSVLNNAFIGAILASIIILLFLGNLRNTLIIVLSIPVSIIATFILIEKLGLSINTISLGGLALGVGLIVDSSVVVIENIFRHLEESKQERFATVVSATREVGIAITSSTLTSVVVFLPLAFLVGLAAVLLGELALTVVFALSFSIIVALTLVPALSFKLMRVNNQQSSWSVITRTWQNLFMRLVEIYRPSIALALRHPWLTLLVAVLLLVGSIGLIVPVLDVELLPAINEGEFRIELNMPEGTRLEVTDQICQQVENYLAARSDVEKYYAVIGQTARIGETKTNTANITVKLTSTDQESINQTMAEVRHFCEQIPAVRSVVEILTGTQGMETKSVNVRLNGSDLQVLTQTGEEIFNRLRAVPGVVNLQSSIQEGLPEYVLHIDRARVADLGLNYADIAATLRFAYLGSIISRFSAFGDEYDITLQLDDNQAGTINELMNLPLLNRFGQTVPLHAVTRLELGSSPSEIKRFDQQRVIEFKADVAGRSSREVNAEIRRIMARMPLPPDYFITYAGMSKGIRDSFTSLGYALLIAIFLVYVVMGSQFNSFIHPFTIAFSIPLAVIGLLLGLLVFGAAISTNAFLGGIMLVGIVVNNGILLIDYIGQLRAKGMNKIEAIINGAAVRLRPILITSLTTIFGMLPIALGLGEGGEALKPLGAVVVGGLAASTFLTLIIIPVIYSLMDRLSTRGR